jgi:hypothetical protein
VFYRTLIKPIKDAVFDAYSGEIECLVIMIEGVGIKRMAQGIVKSHLFPTV